MESWDCSTVIVIATYYLKLENIGLLTCSDLKTLHATKAHYHYTVLLFYFRLFTQPLYVTLEQLKLQDIRFQLVVIWKHRLLYNFRSDLFCAVNEI